MSIIRTFAAAAAVATVLSGIGATQAADDPAAVVEYRKNVMGILGGSISGVFALLEGKVSWSQHMVNHAVALDKAAKMVLDVFPEGSTTPESRAKPEIWTNWATFEAAGKALQMAAADLVVAAEGGDMAAISAAAGKVGDACGGCHKPFRTPKE
ncbi:MAG: cytochrome c [Alphaproteobacteria bacterium]|nr:cytochrome c [Alphaproteobacteria bacterium]